jgi:prevent-host-death family protein
VKQRLKTIGAFDARTRLSELLDQVDRRAVYLITKHGRPVAELKSAVLQWEARWFFLLLRNSQYAFELVRQHDDFQSQNVDQGASKTSHDSVLQSSRDSVPCMHGSRRMRGCASG